RPRGVGSRAAGAPAQPRAGAPPRSGDRRLSRQAVRADRVPDPALPLRTRVRGGPGGRRAPRPAARVRGGGPRAAGAVPLAVRDHAAREATGDRPARAHRTPARPLRWGLVGGGVLRLCARGRRQLPAGEVAGARDETRTVTSPPVRLAVL